jgi:chromosome condensin MukBEF complex kleisin-like MukF subunit
MGAPDQEPTGDKLQKKVMRLNEEKVAIAEVELIDEMVKDLEGSRP